ncbi:hypothetical protein NBRC3257_0125 [Gluconobacter thailandicus NBRC 3257]|uniref:Uncharacterized protein n=1 Tax=Gluconobacter thailandicus NBRC 3257 TaxID=1381097 RepID=A0ABQ0ISK2_GLUTH|nr:hypothetical protein NBRC3255_0595 [Gluconobacter thailandicus NBRC 3255]GAD25125.1 hypothetical protein NBRC3257_0125 [Gluconobacter thailandicus NBRC 3257]
MCTGRVKASRLNSLREDVEKAVLSVGLFVTTLKTDAV